MPHPSRHAIASTRVVTADGVRPAAIVCDGHTIEALVPREAIPASVPVDDLGDLVVSPGVIDAHVHVNEPGHADWEGFETATRAAAAAGVTTIVDMPLNSLPVTTTLAALEEKRAAAAGKCMVDVGFYGGLVPGNLADIEPLIDAGVCGLKAFLCDSGLPEFNAAGERELRVAAPILARRGVPLLAHAEIVDPAFARKTIASHHDWTWSRPPSFELAAIALLESVCREFRCPVHIVHLAAAQALDRIVAAKNDGLPLTVETCPHYLHFSADDLAGADTRFKCAPPIRPGDNRRKLWDGLLAGILDTIGSDHSPCPPAMKPLDDWQTAWGGISSLELTLPIVWSQRPRETLLTRMADWLSANPARLVDLDHRKGRLAAGYDADLCVWDPSASWQVDAAQLHHRHKVTPYDGERVVGRVKRTYLRGRIVFDEGSFPSTPFGELVRRGA